MHDRTTKLLLFAIALALWGFLLRPAFTPGPAQAQAQSSDASAQSAGRMILTSDSLYLYHEDGNLYKFDRNLNLQLRALRQFDTTVRSPFDTSVRATFVTLGPK
jgi:hypothetical protein